MQYDLIRLLDPLRFRNCIPSAIALFGGKRRGGCSVGVEWKRTATNDAQKSVLRLSWDIDLLRLHLAEIEEEIEILRTRDDDRATMVELAAVVVAVAVMAHIDPGARFTRRSGTGTHHDYFLNDCDTEMIEIAGRWEAGLPGLFEDKAVQSSGNPTLVKRWVSVTVIMKRPRNRTEGLHK